MMEILAGGEVDLFVPSFPELQREFDLSPFMVELLLSVNLAAHCFTCLIAGNLGDKYGRRPIILMGLAIFIAGSVFCSYAAQYWQLLAGRLLQGIGVSGPAVLTYTLISDMYSVEKQRQLIGILNGAVNLAIGFAPVIGSYINLFFGWRGNFFVLLLFALVCLILSLIFLPSPPIKTDGISISLKEYLPLLRSRRIIYYLLTINLLVQAYWIFVGISPILYMNDLKVSLTEFGFYQGALATAYCLLSFISGYLLRKYGTKKCFVFGLTLLVLFILASIMAIIWDISNPLLITSVVIVHSIGILFPCNIL